MGVLTSEIQIVNSALIKCGADRITSLNDDNNRARLMKERYAVIRDQLISEHPWNFATSYISLAVVDPKPDDVWEYDYVFQMPSNCLRPLSTDLVSGDPWEEIEGNRIACDEPTLILKYIKQVTDVTKYSSFFAEALAWLLASDTCYALTKSSERTDACEKYYRDQLQKARSFDAQASGQPKKVTANGWLAFRRY